MRDRRVATRYAGALLASSRDQGVLAGVAESYAAVLHLAAGNRDLRIFLDSPQVAEREKKELLQQVLGGRIEDVLLRFFFLLIDKNRIEHVQDIGEAFAELVEKEEGVVRARVVTAVPLAEDLAAALRGRLAKMTGKRVILDAKVDPRVIAGVRVTMGDKVLDGTVRTNLDVLRDMLAKTPVR